MHHAHLTMAGRSLLLATVALWIAGCWERIEYRGSGSATTPPQPLAPPAEAEEPATETPATEPASVPLPFEGVPAEDRLTRDTIGRAEQSAPEQPDENFHLDVEAADPPPPSLDEVNEPLPGDDNDRKSASSLLDDLFGPAPESAPDDSSQPDAEPPAAAPSSEVKPQSETVPADQAPSPQPPSPPRAAWLLGINYSLAALANDRGMATDSVPHWLAASRTLAESLDISLEELSARPADPAAAPISRSVLSFLFQQGQRMGRDLHNKHGAATAALFEIAVKSSILQAIYRPGSTTAYTLSSSIADAARRANLPPDQWQFLLELVEQKASTDELRAAVRRLHLQVDQYLATLPPPEPTQQ